VWRLVFVGSVVFRDVRAFAELTQHQRWSSRSAGLDRPTLEAGLPIG
jgi:hypothetical protein